MNELQERLASVMHNIKVAAAQSERNRKDVKLVAVSKKQPLEKILFLKEQGISLFGENRVQELLDKDENANLSLDWHFIGHLQRNKVKYLLRMQNCLMIESLDSWRLAREINKRAKKNERKMPVLIEVNIAEDDNKFGIFPGETVDFVREINNEFNYLDLCGLMTVVPYVDDPEETRPYFRKMSVLKSELKEKGLNLPELSMGMSNDYQVAIEEGATIIRIGSALFGPREY